MAKNWQIAQNYDKFDLGEVMSKQKLYSSNFSLKKKNTISQQELEKVYKITSQNMAEIGLEVNDKSISAKIKIDIKN